MPFNHVEYLRGLFAGYAHFLDGFRAFDELIEQEFSWL